MKKELKEYLKKIGRKGGLAGKGSQARRTAAISANQARWKNHVKKVVDKNRKIDKL